MFATNDSNEEEFKSYFGSMKLDLALPFKAPAIAKLAAKYKIKGIPTLLIFDKKGNLVTNKGREGITDDPAGRSFPFEEKSAWQLLEGSKGLVTAKGEAVSVDALKRAPLGLYFSAHWCGERSSKP